jgi:hypothetical protein
VLNRLGEGHPRGLDDTRLAQTDQMLWARPMADDLTALSGLEERHRRALSLRLGITTYDALARVDAQEVFNALSRNRPRPALDEILTWQRQARSKLGQETADAPGWERAASFVIVFEQRDVAGVTERRLVAEQTELEPEQPPASWSTWEFGGLGRWLQERLGVTDPPAEAGIADAEKPAEPQESVAAEKPAEPKEPGAAEKPAEADEFAELEGSPEPEAAETESASPGTGHEPDPGQAELLVDAVAVVDSSGRVEAVAGGRSTRRDLEGTLPARLEIRVTGGIPGSEVRVALRFRERGRPHWSPQAPISIHSHGTADLELSETAVGRHEVRVVAWAPDASAEPTGVDLGSLTIWPAGRGLRDFHPRGG